MYLVKTVYRERGCLQVEFLLEIWTAESRGDQAAASEHTSKKVRHFVTSRLIRTLPSSVRGLGLAFQSSRLVDYEYSAVDVESAFRACKASESG